MEYINCPTCNGYGTIPEHEMPMAIALSYAEQHLDKIEALKAENARLSEAVMAMDTCAHMIRERTTIDPHRVSHAHLAEMYALTMQISKIARATLESEATDG